MVQIFFDRTGCLNLFMPVAAPMAAVSIIGLNISRGKGMKYMLGLTLVLAPKIMKYT